MKNLQIPNIQLYPTDNFKIAIDNLTRKAFELCFDGKQDVDFDITESHSKNIKSNVKISNLNSLKINFNEFDWAVFDACISEFISGNEYTTAAIIRRHFGGVSKNITTLDQDIIGSLEKLACIRITIDMSDCKKIYDSPFGTLVFRGYLLPTESLEISVNGQLATAIHFLKKGPVFAAAELKNQILTCPAELLQAPVRVTSRSIAINHFLLRRILEMKGSVDASKSNKRVKPLRHTILFDSLYKACGLDNANRKQKNNAREIAEKILNYFVEQALIKAYSIETGKAGKARTINIES